MNPYKRRKHIGVPVAAVLLLVLALSACSFGSRKDAAVNGEVKKKTVEGEASSLTVENIHLKTGGRSYGPKVELLSDGGTRRVEVQAQESLLDAIVIKFSGGSLRIVAAQDADYLTGEPVVLRLYNYSFQKMSFSGACEVSADTVGSREKDLEIILSGASSFRIGTLSAKKLTTDVSGAGALTADEMTMEHFKLDLSGASALSCGACTVSTKCDWHVSGASHMTLAGTGKELFAVVAGASTVKSFDFVQESCVITVSGASTLECHMTQSLGGSVLHASAVYYKGDPETAVEVGSSAVLQKK